MPEANKIKKDEVMVDLDTSGPDTEVSLPEDNVEEKAIIETERREPEPDNTNRAPVIEEEASNPGEANPEARKAKAIAPKSVQTTTVAPKAKAAEIVIPDLEVPGINAKH